MMPMMFGDYGMGMGIFGMIFMLLIWILVIVALIYLIQAIMNKGESTKISKEVETAEEILKKRFAKGEMSIEEFEEAMAVLRKNTMQSS
jgi:putative membrane protein